MIFCYLDASAWVKRYHQEAGTIRVLDLFASNLLLACSPLGLVEVIATLSRKRKASGPGNLQFDEKLRETEADWRNFLQIQFTDEVTRLATETTKKFALRGADAIHLASALFLRQRFTEADDEIVLITSDRELIAAAQASSLTVIDPTEKENNLPNQ